MPWRDSPQIGSRRAFSRAKRCGHGHCPGRQNRLTSQHRVHTRQVAEGEIERSGVEILMYQGAFRPHPALLAVMHRMRAEMSASAFPKMIQGNSSGHVSSNNYLSLHARIKPDMQFHTRCLSLKVRTLQHILTNLTSYFHADPRAILLATNRKRLEGDVLGVALDNKTPLASENIR